MRLTGEQRLPDRGGWASVRAAVRGVGAVLALLLGAADALLTAVVGVPPLAWLGRRIGREVAAEYRRGRENAVDVEIVDGPR